MQRYKRKLSMMEHSVPIHSAGETEPEPDCIHSQLHFHDVHDIALDLIFKHVSVPSACVLRRVCKRWNKHLDTSYQFATVAIPNKDLPDRNLQDYVKQRKQYVRNMFFYGTCGGSQTTQEDITRSMLEFCHDFNTSSELQRLHISEFNMESCSLKSLIEKQLPKQCRLFLTKLLISDVDRYLLPASWYLNAALIEKRSGSVRIGSAPVCVALNQDFQPDKKEVSEAFLAKELQILAQVCAKPMDEFELNALKTRLNRMLFKFFGPWLEQVLEDILKQYEDPEFVYVNVIQLELAGLSALTVRLLERLLMEIMSSGVLNNNL